MENLYIVIPAYNEAENIGNVIDDWYPIVQRIAEEGGTGSRLVIIDDGSKDATYRIMTDYAKERCYSAVWLPLCAECGCGLYLSDRFRWTNFAGGILAFLGTAPGL